MDNSCSKTNCMCTHTDGCVKGFISIRYVDRKKIMRNGIQTETETWYDGVEFCPTCDPERAQIQRTSKSSEEMAERLKNRSQFKVSENYDKQEASKTRTL